MSPVSHMHAPGIGSVPRCGAVIVRRERLYADRTAQCDRMGGHEGPHRATDPFDAQADVRWPSGLGTGVLLPKASGTAGPLVSLDNHGQRVLDDSPSASDTLGAPSGEPDGETDPTEPNAEELVRELGEICDVLGRHLTMLRVELEREKRLRRDAEIELRNLRGQVAA